MLLTEERPVDVALDEERFNQSDVEFPMKLRVRDWTSDREPNCSKRMSGRKWLLISSIIGGLIATIAAVPCSTVLHYPAGFVWLSIFFAVLLACGSVRTALGCIERADGKHETNSASIFAGGSGKFLMFFGVLIPLVNSVFLIMGSFSQNSFGWIQGVVSCVVPMAILLAWQEVRAKATSIRAFRRVTLACAAIYVLSRLISVIATAPTFFDAFWTLVPTMGITCFIVCLGRNLLASPCKFGIGSVLSMILFLLACFLPSSAEIFRGLKVVAINSDVPMLRQIAHYLTSEPELKQAIQESSGAVNAQFFHFPIRPAAYCEAYYRFTGETYSLSGLSSLEKDVFYAAPTVGSVKVDNLKISSSVLDTEMDSKQLCASFNWTLDFANTGGAPGQEARLQLNIPKNSAITGVQLYSSATSAESGANFSATLPLLKQYADEAIQQKDPVIITKLGADKVLLRTAPVLPSASMRVCLNIVSPLVPASDHKSASVQVPSISSSNVRELCPQHLKMFSEARVGGEQRKTLRSGDSCELAINKSNNLYIATSVPTIAAFHVADETGQQRKVVRHINEDTAGSEAFVVAIDGSKSNAISKAEVADFVERNPQGKIKKILFGDLLHGTREFSIRSASAQIRSAEFIGGDSNWELLSKAIQTAKDNHAQVLWIHSAKPWTVNRNWLHEIGYECGVPAEISKLCANSVKVYDYQTNAGDNEIVERIVASGGDIAPFAAVANHGNLGKDLDSLFAEHSEEVSFSFANQGDRRITSLAGDKKLVALADASALKDLINRGKRKEAEVYAKDCNQVSIYTAAFCNQPGALAKAPHQPEQNLSGGVIGPQGGDATVIQGVNVAGTVRVNNLANLEALLNLIANSAEIVAICWGLPMMVVGLIKFNRVGGPGRAILGGTILSIGLAIPGCLNWLVASTRDVDMFS